MPCVCQLEETGHVFHCEFFDFAVVLKYRCKSFENLRIKIILVKHMVYNSILTDHIEDLLIIKLKKLYISLCYFLELL